MYYHRRNLDSFQVGAKIIFVANEHNISLFFGTSVICVSEQLAFNYNIIFKLVGAVAPIRSPPSYANVYYDFNSYFFLVSNKKTYKEGNPFHSSSVN